MLLCFHFIYGQVLMFIIDCLNCRMPGGASKGKVKKHFKAKHQKKRVFRSSDPILSVFMWGVNHTVSIYYIPCVLNVWFILSLSCVLCLMMFMCVPAVV